MELSVVVGKNHKKLTEDTITESDVKKWLFDQLLEEFVDNQQAKKIINLFAQLEQETTYLKYVEGDFVIMITKEEDQ